MKLIRYTILLSLIFNLNSAFASENHDKKEDSHSSEKSHEEGKEEHGDHKEHAEGEKHAGHDEEGEENPQVGADKGIVEANKEKGFKLSPEAEKNFSVKKLKVMKPQNIEIPKEALVTSGVEINLYRLRDGFYKRIDFTTVTTKLNSLIINSKDLSQNDEIALSGLGFLRISEISAFEGAPEGHSH